MKYLEIKQISESQEILHQLESEHPNLTLILEPYSCKASKKQKRKYPDKSIMSFLVNTLDLSFPDYDFSEIRDDLKTFKNKTYIKIPSDISQSDNKEKRKIQIIPNLENENLKNCEQISTNKDILNEFNVNKTICGCFYLNRLHCSVNKKVDMGHSCLDKSLVMERGLENAVNNLVKSCTSSNKVDDLQIIHKTKNQEKPIMNTKSIDVTEISKLNMVNLSLPNISANRIFQTKSDLQKKRYSLSNSFKIMDISAVKREIYNFFALLNEINYKELIDSLFNIINKFNEFKDSQIYQFDERIGPFQESARFFCYLFYCKSRKRIILFSGILKNIM